MVETTKTELRIGDWIQTFLGRCFWPLDPRPEEVFIEDIAHSLALRCRFGGHSRCFYSVAEHSVIVSQHLPKELALWGLLHDAAEAYSADVPRPLKRSLQEWKPIEQNIMQAICTRYGLENQEPTLVKHIDSALLHTERRILMLPCEQAWTDTTQALDTNILCLPPDQAEAMFLNRFYELNA